MDPNLFPEKLNHLIGRKGLFNVVVKSEGGSPHWNGPRSFGVRTFVSDPRILKKYEHVLDIVDDDSKDDVDLWNSLENLSQKVETVIGSNNPSSSQGEATSRRKMDAIDGNDPVKRQLLDELSTTTCKKKIIRDYTPGRGPPTFKLGGQNFHQIGSLVPRDEIVPKFAQLYIYDTQNEDFNRIHSVRKEDNVHSLHIEIVANIREMLDTHNVLVKSFQMIGEKISQDLEFNLTLKLIGKRTSDPRLYNLPSVGEQWIFFEDDDDASDVYTQESIRESKFLAWMKANEKYPLEKTLTYPEFPQKFVWKADQNMFGNNVGNSWPLIYYIANVVF
ncbi:unnamed protein product [Cuscuta campestris]|uniref:Helitron helicase-like domain-containing protein n=1 Tax=Cuscuta campestris TaxID=132261 RepID=A0A484KC07_9ASTE|nr:unnamed protein product [Cuscuta campestris]